MKKKEYEQPKTDVVELRVMNQLLAGSGGLENPSGFPNEGDPLVGA